MVILQNSYLIFITIKSILGTYLNFGKITSHYYETQNSFIYNHFYF